MGILKYFLGQGDTVDDTVAELEFENSDRGGESAFARAEAAMDRAANQHKAANFSTSERRVAAPVERRSQTGEDTNYTGPERRRAPGERRLSAPGFGKRGR